MAEPEEKPPDQKPTATQETLEELSWEFPFVRTIKTFFIKEGKAVKNGWVAVAVIIGITIYFTYSCTKRGVDEKLSGTTNYFSLQISDIKGQLSNAKQDRDKYQIMLTPFEAAALKIYTNEPLERRLDLLINELNGFSKEADIDLIINDKTNLIVTDSPIGTSIQISNYIVINNRRIKIDIQNKSKYAAINSFIGFSSYSDPKNFDADGWILQPNSVNGQSFWLWEAQKSIAYHFEWEAATINITTNFTGNLLKAMFTVGADNAERKDYIIGFIFNNKSVTNTIDKP